MVSRVTSLDGLAILWPFDKSKMCCHQSEETRDELKHLEILKLNTVLKFGIAIESSHTKRQLHVLTTLDIDESYTSPVDLANDPNSLLDSLQR
jgi:hypothetical protein